MAPLVYVPANAVATALAAWLICDTGLALGYRPRTALALGLSYGLATMAWPYAKNWYSEPSVAMLVLLTFDAGIRVRLYIAPSAMARQTSAKKLRSSPTNCNQ